jgi:hypothetical protein
MLGLREEVADIPYDLISSVRLDKGVFSSSVIFTAPGLRSTGRLGHQLSFAKPIDAKEIFL